MKKRNLNMDLIRCVAVFSVISVHFFLNSNFYTTLLLGKRMYFLTILRTGFMVCVPLFLLLTGYLMSNKKLSNNYYWGIIKILGIYLGASVCCGLFRYFYLGEKSIKNLILGIFSFDTANYAWYIEMYIGLFLLIPFLNIIGDNMKNKKEDKILIITCMILTLLPSVLNIYNWENFSWWTHPSMSFEYNKLVPEFWIAFYPVTYYFIGRYIKKYDLKIQPFKGGILWVIVLLVFGSFNYWRSYGNVFNGGNYTDWGGFENTISATLLFVILKTINLEKISKIGKRIITIISEMSLGMYLVSWIFDTFFYKILNEKIEYMPDKLPYYFVIVPLVFGSSFILSLFINIICKFLDEKLLVNKKR